MQFCGFLLKWLNLANKNLSNKGKLVHTFTLVHSFTSFSFLTSLSHSSRNSFVHSILLFLFPSIIFSCFVFSFRSFPHVTSQLSPCLSSSALRINGNSTCIWQLSLQSHMNSDALSETHIHRQRRRQRSQWPDLGSWGFLQCIVS